MAVPDHLSGAAAGAEAALAGAAARVAVGLADSEAEVLVEAVRAEAGEGKDRRVRRVTWQTGWRRDES